MTLEVPCLELACYVYFTPMCNCCIIKDDISKVHGDER